MNINMSMFILFLFVLSFVRYKHRISLNLQFLNLFFCNHYIIYIKKKYYKVI